MRCLDPVPRPVHVSLAQIPEDAVVVRWPQGELGGGLWHRPSRWRGLKPGQGIPDDLRAASTLCSLFVVVGFEHRTAEVSPDERRCIDCDSEWALRQGRDDGSVHPPPEPR